MKLNWQTKKLGELCDFVRGPFGGSLKKSIFKDRGYAVYEQQHAIYNQFDAIRYFINKDKFKEMKRFELKPGTLIMSCSGTMGKTAIVPNTIKQGIINQALLMLSPSKSIDVKFLQHLIQSDVFQQNIRDRSQGAAIQNVASVKILKNIDIKIPSLSEQQRIVKILNEVFEGIEKAKQNTEKNLQNVKGLFESYLNNIFSNHCDDWEEETLESVTSKIGSGATPSGGKKTYKSDGISLIRSLNVHDAGFKEKNLAYINNHQAEKLSNVIIESQDILLNITGASVARCCIVPEKILPARVNQHVSIIRLTKNNVLPEFIHYELISKKYKDILLKIGEQGATRQAITKKQIENVVVRFPMLLSEQELIIKRINILQAETKKLEENYKKKLVLLDELKKSVLQKAFSGEL